MHLLAVPYQLSILTLTILLLAVPARAQDQALTPANEITQQIRSGERHAYSISAGSGEPGTREEAAAISALTGTSDRIVALGFEANRALVTSQALTDYRVIHFATHSLLNTEQPELSGIVLSLVDEAGRANNGFLQVQDIYNLRLPAELVVLSACQTGLGKNIRGEGRAGRALGRGQRPFREPFSALARASAEIEERPGLAKVC